MVRKDEVYDAYLLDPPEYVSFQQTYGTKTTNVQYPVWNDKSKPDLELIQCDLCNKLVQLVKSNKASRLPTHLKRHWNQAACIQRQKKLMKSGGPSITEEVEVDGQDFRNLFSGHFEKRSNHMDLPPSSPPPQSSPITAQMMNLPAVAEARDSSGYQPCNGHFIEWTPGCLLETYAWLQHDNDSITWKPTGFKLGTDNSSFPLSNTSSKNDMIRLQSKDCKGSLTTPEDILHMSCIKCYELVNSPQIIKMMARAEEAPAHTPYQFLSPRQMKNLLTLVRKKERQLHLELLNAGRKIARLKKRVSDYKRVVMLVAQHKIAGVARILSVAHRNGASPEALCRKLDTAISAATSISRSRWSNREFDVAFLIKALGGPRLLYALSAADAYPSSSTLRRHKHIPELRISAGIPVEHDFKINITSLFGVNARQPPLNRLVGQVLAVDDVAIEQVIRYDLEQECVVGLCREHADTIDKSIRNISDIEVIAGALHENKICHYGKEATVVGLAPISAVSNYQVTPVVLATSCKAEKGDDLAAWFREFIQTYREHPDGERRHGPIRTIATDGAAPFRRLRALLCLGQRLSSNDPRYSTLSKLPGLNLFCGENGILGTADPKHVVKRFASMLRSSQGIMLDTIYITRDNIFTALITLPHITPDKARTLLDPADKQNVPKAVHLIQSLFDLTESEDPLFQERLRSIKFIATVLTYFLSPFIDVKMHLAEQIRNLSTYSHLITALYTRHALSFMSGALVADSQAVVKNIIWTTVTLQHASPDIPYYILFEGTDRLENIFSHVRTQDHSRNFDILQLSHKLSIAAEIDAVLQRHPDLDRGHVRRNLVNARGVDHVNPKSWIGDVRVGDVNVRAEYLEGRKIANKLLEEFYNHDNASIDWDTIFANPKIDHLRPGGRYVGLNEDFSHSNDEDSDINQHITASESSSLISSHQNSSITSGLALEDASDSVDHYEQNRTDFTVDKLNPLTNIDSTSQNKPHCILIEGIQRYIPTVVNDILNPDREKHTLVTTRNLRVRGQTVEKALRGQALNSSTGDEDELDLADGKVKSGDIGAILVRAGQNTCLAVIEMLNFSHRKVKFNCATVDAEALGAEGEDKVTATVQILELIPRDPTERNINKLTWYWSKRYLQLKENSGLQTGPQHFVTQISGNNIYLLSPTIVYDDDNRPTWSLCQTDLQHAFDTTLAGLDGMDAVTRLQTVESMPQIKSTKQGIPYHVPMINEDVLCIKDRIVSQLLDFKVEKLPGATKRSCNLCGADYQIRDMRNHVGKHILKAQRDVPDDSLLPGIQVGFDPCGWCGKDGQCVTQMVKTKRSYTIRSNCLYHYSRLQYNAAQSPSLNAPCTNIPLACPLCPLDSKRRPGVFWKYVFLQHMVTNHLTESGHLPSLSPQLVVMTHINTWEEENLGVPKVKTRDWRKLNGMVDSDFVARIGDDLHSDVPELEETVGSSLVGVLSTGPYRKRAFSTLSALSASSQQGPPAKKATVDV